MASSSAAWSKCTIMAMSIRWSTLMDATPRSCPRTDHLRPPDAGRRRSTGREVGRSGFRVSGDELLDHWGDLLTPAAAVEDAILTDLLGEMIEIGRATGRERVCRYGKTQGVAGAIK